MCGITGIVYDDAHRPVDVAVLQAMNEQLRHRGPDDAGMWTAPGVGLAMRRLAIINVAGGRQPVHSHDGQVVAVLNGELYNYQTIREALQSHGCVLRDGSDAEVLPAAWQVWGRRALDHFDGMFALAIWDARRRRLFLARDRLGKKPLYYCQSGGGLYFASELKALQQVPGLDWTIDHRALARYLHFEYIPAPDTIFSGVHKLAAGTCLIWEAGQATVEPWWTLPPGQSTSVALSAAVPAFRAHLDSAVHDRLMADVPLGVFLSGGIDSTSIVATLRHMAPDRPIHTFAIGFDDPHYDESAHAQAAARHLRTEHRTRIVSARTVLDELPVVAGWLDEPLADDSLLPTALLCRFAREHVTVALSGDGGDELFAGYQTFMAERWYRWYRLLPHAVRARVLPALVARLPVRDAAFSLDFKARKFVEAADQSVWARHAGWVGTSLTPGVLARLTGVAASDILPDLQDDPVADWRDALEQFYLRYYLPEDILTKMDRASMAASLEVRAPFLDHRLVGFCRQLPFDWKLRRGTSKWFLKTALRDRLPPQVVKRAKKGFGMPVAGWLKGGLRELVEDLLAPERLRRQGLLDVSLARRYVDAHMRGEVNHRQIVWALLMLQLWHDRWAQPHRHVQTPACQAGGAA